ncbi:MAG: hypothetical protein JWR80_7967 [Bradyrhizobium sp.]|nr:hypothetical protein [Bradyrhizobium sp.]
MKTIRDAQILIGMLEQGELNQELSAELNRDLAYLAEMSEENRKATYKGSLTLKLDIEVENGVVHISGNIDSKLPKKPRRSSLFWVTEDGQLSTEHPQQHDMFPVRDATTGRA